MKKFVVAIPCVISGLLMGAMTLSQAAPVQPPGGGYSPQASVRKNLVIVQNFNNTQSVYGCFGGLDLTDCIDPPISFDTDTTFKLLAGAGVINCGVTPMAVGSTCQYSQAVYGALCDDSCGSASIAANQAYVDPTAN